MKNLIKLIELTEKDWELIDADHIFFNSNIGISIVRDFPIYTVLYPTNNGTATVELPLLTTIRLVLLINKLRKKGLKLAKNTTKNQTNRKLEDLSNYVYKIIDKTL